MPRKYDRDNKPSRRRTRASRLSGGELAGDPLTSAPGLSWAGKPLRSSSRREPSPLYRFPGKNPLISLDCALNFFGFFFDFLVRIETFQGLIATPQAGKLLSVLSPHEERLSRVISAAARPKVRRFRSRVRCC
jgi:hypothetical protein